MFEIFILHVGHGDSILLKFPDNQWAIIDCNTISDLDSCIPALNVIKNEKAKIIEFICITHLHADHYHGLPQILEYLDKNHISLKRFVDSNFNNTFRKIYTEEIISQYIEETRKSEFVDIKEIDKIFFHYIKNNLRKGLKYIPVFNYPTRIIKNHDITIEAISPDSVDHFSYLYYLDGKKIIKEKPSLQNLISIVLKIQFGKNVILLGGDAESHAWGRIFKNIKDEGDPALKADLLKVSHHGSTSNLDGTINIFEAIKKKNSIAVISSGGRDGLPHQEVVENINNNGYSLFCTNMANECAEADTSDFSFHEKTHAKYQPNKT